VLPAAQIVDPVHPAPPHCPYLGTVAPVGAVTAVVVATTDFEVVATTTLEELTAVETGLGEPPADCPLQTAGPGTV